jgi:hypothetical protein
MNTSHTHHHAQFLIREFIKATIIECFKQADPVQMLNDHAKKFWVELLPAKFMATAKNQPEKITIQNATDDLEIPPGVWKPEGGNGYLPILTKLAIASDATGVTIMGLEAADSFIKQKSTLSQNALAIIVPTEEVNLPMSQISIEKQQVALLHGPSKQTLVFPCFILQLGVARAVRDITAAKAFTPIPSQTVIFTKFKSKE